MELKIFQEIMQNRYSPKEALGYYVSILNEITERMSISEIIIILQKRLLTISRSNAKEELTLKSLEKIRNYWNLSIEQVVDYGYILFNYLKFESKMFTQDTLTDTFIYVMKLYSPDNAVSFVNKKLGYY